MFSVSPQLAAIFLAPAVAAAGLAAVGLPIAIHLLSRARRRTEPWAAMRFLLEAYRRQRRRLRLEQWLLLMVRCLVVLMLGLALAGPVASEAMAWLTGRGGGPVVHLVIDDAMGSSVRSSAGDAVENAASTDGSAEATARTRLNDLIEGAIADLAGDSDRTDLSLPSDARVTVWSLATGQPLVREATAQEAAETLRSLHPAPLDRAWSDTFAAIDQQAREQRDRAHEVRVVSTWSRGRTLQTGDRWPAGFAERANVRVTRPMDAAPNTQLLAIEPSVGVVVPDNGNLTVAATVRLRRFGSSATAETDRIRVRLVGPSAQTGQAVDPEESVATEVLAETVIEHRWASQSTGRDLDDGSDAIGNDRAVGAHRLSLSIPMDRLEALSGSSTAMSAGDRSLALIAELEDRRTDRLSLDNRVVATLAWRPAWRIGIFDRPAPRGQASTITPGTWWSLAMTAGAESGTVVVPLSDLPSDFRGTAQHQRPTQVRTQLQAQLQAQLQTLDAVVIAAPETLGADTWLMLGQFVENGGLIWLTPPAVTEARVDESSRASAVPSAEWTDRAAKALKLPWRFALEATPTAASPMASATLADPLRRLSADWSALLSDVRVQRVWPVNGVEASSVWAALPDGTIWIAAHMPFGVDDTSFELGESADLNGSLDGVPAGTLSGTSDPNEATSEGRGMIVWMASALSPIDSNLPSRPLLVALTQEVTRRFAGGEPASSMDGRAAVAGSVARRWLPLAITATTAAKSSTDRNSIDPVPMNADGQALWQSPGVYQDQRGVWHAIEVVTDAGDTRALNDTDLRTFWGDLNWTYLDEPLPAATPSSAQTLRWPLLWVTLALVLLEAWLARQFSHAGTSSAASGASSGGVLRRALGRLTGASSGTGAGA